MGQQMSKKSDFILFRMVNVVILNSEPRFLHLPGRKPEVVALCALFDIYLLSFPVADAFLTLSMSSGTTASG